MWDCFCRTNSPDPSSSTDMVVYLTVCNQTSFVTFIKMFRSVLPARIFSKYTIRRWYANLNLKLYKEMWSEYTLIFKLDEKTFLFLICKRFTNLFSFLYRAYSLSLSSGLTRIACAAENVVSIFLTCLYRQRRTNVCHHPFLALFSVFFCPRFNFSCFNVNYIFPHLSPIIRQPVHSKKISSFPVWAIWINAIS